MTPLAIVFWGFIAACVPALVALGLIAVLFLWFLGSSETPPRLF